MEILLKQELDYNGNIVYEEYDSGYKEYNTYENGVLVRQECHYPQGQVEVEHYNVK